MSDVADDRLGEHLRSQGRRLTPQRERVLAAVRTLGHGTPEEISAEVGRDGGVPLPASTVYRALEALEEAGVLRHTHLDHRSPSYQAADHGVHVHLVCNDCGGVDEVPVEVADGFVAAVVAATGFEAALGHSAVRGRCRRCRG